jgi:hypothetical protein
LLLNVGDSPALLLNVGESAHTPLIVYCSDAVFFKKNQPI